MTSELCKVEDCGRVVGDTAYVCRPCGDRLRESLSMLADQGVPVRQVLQHPHLPEHVRCAECGTGVPGHPVVNEYRKTGLAEVDPGLVADLEQAMSKVSSAAVARGALAYAYRPAEARWTLRDTLTAVADEVARVRGLFRPFNTQHALGGWLVSQIDWMRHQPAGGELIGELIEAMRQAWASIDNPGQRVLAGVCEATIADAQGMSVECGTPLYAPAAAVEIECSRCGTVTGTEPAWDRMLDRSEDVLFTRTELVHSLRVLGVVVTTDQIKGWVRRGRLSSHGLDQGTPPRPLYRLGDVRDILDAGEGSMGA